MEAAQHWLDTAFGNRTSCSSGFDFHGKSCSTGAAEEFRKLQTAHLARLDHEGGSFKEIRITTRYRGRPQS
jgi:hypothetical protein